MKKILTLLVALFTAPLFSGPYCIDKQGHSLACPCNCDAVRGRYCIDCTHLHDARPITVVEPLLHSPLILSPSKDGGQAKKTTVRIPETPQDVLEKLATQYVKNKNLSQK
jgi:hypothetical protein